MFSCSDGHLFLCVFAPLKVTAGRGTIQKVVPSIHQILANWASNDPFYEVLFASKIDYMILGNASSQFLFKIVGNLCILPVIFHTQGLYQCPVLHISVSLNQNEMGQIFFLSPNYFGIILSAISSVVGNLTTILSNVRVFLFLCLALVRLQWGSCVLRLTVSRWLALNKHRPVLPRWPIKWENQPLFHHPLASQINTLVSVWMCVSMALLIQRFHPTVQRMIQEIIKGIGPPK